MTKRLPTAAFAVLLAASTTPIANVASAMPMANALVVKNAAPSDVETVQWRGRGWHGGNWAVGAALLGGAVIAGMLAAPYYGPGPYYGPAPYYGPPAYYGHPAYYRPVAAPGYVAPPPGNAVAYCMQRFRSYDPGSGTYLGYDGFRHPCP